MQQPATRKAAILPKIPVILNGREYDARLVAITGKEAAKREIPWVVAHTGKPLTSAQISTVMRLTGRWPLLHTKEDRKSKRMVIRRRARKNTWNDSHMDMKHYFYPKDYDSYASRKKTVRYDKGKLWYDDWWMGRVQKQQILNVIANMAKTIEKKLSKLANSVSMWNDVHVTQDEIRNAAEMLGRLSEKPMITTAFSTALFERIVRSVSEPPQIVAQHPTLSNGRAQRSQTERIRAHIKEIGTLVKYFINTFVRRTRLRRTFRIDGYRRDFDYMRMCLKRWNEARVLEAIVKAVERTRPEWFNHSNTNSSTNSNINLNINSNNNRVKDRRARKYGFS